MANDGLILVIDDEPLVRDLLCSALEETGRGVVAAGSGEEARSVFAEHADRIRLVLLDLSLPDVEAGALYEELLAVAPAPASAKWLLISGYGEGEARERFGREGLSGFLSKPFLMDDLFGLVERVLAE